MGLRGVRRDSTARIAYGAVIVNTELPARKQTANAIADQDSAAIDAKTPAPKAITGQTAPMPATASLGSPVIT